jgi:phosphoglycolate phosphatase-like HAD superfamily hydrolase
VIKAVIFDFDGVLVESAHIKTEAFRRLFSHWGNKVDEIVRYHIQNAGISRYVKFKNIYENILHDHYTEEIGLKLGKEFSKIVLDEIKSAHFVKGANEFLHENYNNYFFFIASGTPQNELNKIVRFKKIEKYFKDIFGTPTTKPEIIDDILKKNKLDKEEVVFVGDGESDKLAAESMEIHFILRLTAENNHISSRHTIKDLTELNKKLGEIDSVYA